MAESKLCPLGEAKRCGTGVIPTWFCKVEKYPCPHVHPCIACNGLKMNKTNWQECMRRRMEKQNNKK